MSFPGIDMIEIERFSQACLRRPKLKERLFTKKELDALNNKKEESWAVRFAGKEAVLKALGTGLGPLSWHDIEIFTSTTGEPWVTLSPKAQEVARRRGGSEVRLSFSHDRSKAIAMAILV